MELNLRGERRAAGVYVGLLLRKHPMARSLTVKHTEAPGTSGLLNAFLLVAFGWLVASMLFAGVSASAATEGAPSGEINGQ